MMLSKTAELVAVMDVNPDFAEKCKEKYGAKYAFTNYEELLALDEIEAVYIASPVFCHKEQALAAVKAKKHILLEKPMGLTVADSEEINMNTFSGSSAVFTDTMGEKDENKYETLMRDLGLAN